MHVCGRACVRACVRVCMCMYACACLQHIRARTHTHTRTRTHTHTHTHTHSYMHMYQTTLAWRAHLLQAARRRHISTCPLSIWEMSKASSDDAPTLPTPRLHAKARLENVSAIHRIKQAGCGGGRVSMGHRVHAAGTCRFHAALRRRGRDCPSAARAMRPDHALPAAAP